MKDTLRIIGGLTIIYIVAGVLMTMVFAKAVPVRIEAEKKEKEIALKAMAPEAEAIIKVGEWEPYPKKRDEYFYINVGGKKTGYIVSTQGKGYQSYIRIFVALNLDHTIRKIDVIWQGETPGFGEEIQKPKFEERFIGKRLSQMRLVTVEDPDAILAVTGATISSRGVVEGLRRALQMIEERHKPEVG